ncbi:MAG: DUF3306 domain-containing protein [Pseudomonadota bacterium]
MASDSEGFLGRWWRLKQAAKEARPAAAPVSDADPTKPEGDAKEGAAAGRPSQAPVAEASPGPIDPADLPAIESLDANSNYSVFLREGVPEGLRRQALRKLWMSDPVLSQPDPLDLHAIDYNAVPTFPEGVKTLYQVGRGMIAADDKPEQATPAGPHTEAKTEAPEEPKPAASESETERGSDRAGAGSPATKSNPEGG